MTAMHPSPHHIMVSRSPVDTTEETTRTGIHVVRNVDPSDRRVHRGTVIEIGSEVEDDWADLRPGAVLFYLTATKLGEYDFVLCSYDTVIAWEDA